MNEISPEQVIADMIRKHNAGFPNIPFMGAHVSTIADALQDISPETFNRELWVDYVWRKA
jgi:hypothetical protein